MVEQPTFSVGEAATLREMLGDPAVSPRCPHCRGSIVISHPVAGGTVGPFWDVRCDDCLRHTIVSELPPDRRPKRP